MLEIRRVLLGGLLIFRNLDMAIVDEMISVAKGEGGSRCESDREFAMATRIHGSVISHRTFATPARLLYCIDLC